MGKKSGMRTNPDADRISQFSPAGRRATCFGSGNNLALVVDTRDTEQPFDT
jgi:hypothetical protein